MLTILFTDVEESTEMIERLGDIAAHNIIKIHNKIIGTSIAECDGQPIKYLGDGVMATFDSASSAVRCAIKIQQLFHNHNQSNDNKIVIRIGINAGEPLVIGNDLFGIAVQAAARICNQAKGNEILVSAVIKQLVAGKQFKFVNFGPTKLKGLIEPVHLYKVDWQATG